MKTIRLTYLFNEKYKPNKNVKIWTDFLLLCGCGTSSVLFVPAGRSLRRHHVLSGEGNITK
jgi:hypothetical protein